MALRKCATASRPRQQSSPAANSAQRVLSAGGFHESLRSTVAREAEPLCLSRQRPSSALPQCHGRRRDAALSGWSATLNDALSEHSLNYDERRTVFELHPIDDYFFAAVVALEAARLRTLYTPREAEELLSEIGEQVDVRAGRRDRVVSDLCST